MVLPLIAVGVAAAAGIATSLIGNAASAADRRQANRLRQQALSEWNKVQPEDYSDVRSLVEKLAEEGMIDPKTQLSILALDSEGRSAVGDPQALDAQSDALEYLQSVMSSDGLSPQDQAFYYEISDRLARDSKIANANIMADMQQRGVAGSGMELANKMGAAQSAQQTASREGLNLAAMAMQRKDQAANQAGQLGLAMRGQQFGEAQARDQMFMNAQAQNFGMGLESAKMNYNTRQSEFDQKATVAAGKSGQMNQNAAAKDRDAQRISNQWSNMGQGVTSAAGSVAQYGMQQDYLDRVYPSPDTQQTAAASTAAPPKPVLAGGLWQDPDYEEWASQG